MISEASSYVTQPEKTMETSTENKNNVTCLQEIETFQKPAETLPRRFLYTC